MVDVGRDDRASARDLVAHELRRDRFRQRSAERLAPVLAAHQLAQRLQPLVFAYGDELHFRRHRPAARVVHLRHVHPRLGTTRPALQVEAQRHEIRVRQPVAPIGRRRAGQLLCVAALENPLAAHGGQPLPDVDLRRRIGVGPGGVVHEQRRVFLGAKRGRRVGLAHLPHRNSQVRARARHVDLA